MGQKPVSNMPKNAPRGSILQKYDPTNKILFVQWKDNKVVNLISTLGMPDLVEVERRIGSEKVKVPCVKAIQHYVQHMMGIDVVDYHNRIGGGFTHRAHFKKWYKKVLLGVVDFMRINGRYT